MNSIRVSLVWIILKESGKSIGTSGDAKGIIKSVIAICTYDSKAINVSFGNFSVSQFKRYAIGQVLQSLFDAAIQ